MTIQSFGQTLISAQIDGTALTASTTATSIIPAAAKFSLPANTLMIGSVLRVKAVGRITTVVTIPGLLTLDVRFGASTVQFTSNSIALNVVAQTNATWLYEAMLTCRGIGSAATILGTGSFTSRASINAPAVGTTNGVGVVPLPDTAPTVGTAFDSTAAQVVDFFGTWSTNNANSIQVHQYTLELMN